MSPSFAFPSLDDFITVPELLEFQYKLNPTRPAYVYTEDGKDEPTEITFLEFVRAAHRAARIVRPGRSGPDGEVIGVVALVDNLVYQAIAAGIILAGAIPLLISPRLTPAAVVNLLKKSGAHRLLATKNTLKELLKGVEDELSLPGEPAYDVKVEEIAGLAQLYPKLGVEEAEDLFEAYPSASSYPKPKDIALYLHSSGSTGLPKAIPITHNSLLNGWAVFSPTALFRDNDVRLAAMPLPPFHALGFYTQFVVMLYASVTVALYPPTVTTPDSLTMTVTPDNILSHIKRTRSDSLIIMPAMLQIWSQSPSSVDLLQALKVVIFAGGPLTPLAGDHLVSSGVRLRSVYGGTEFGIPIDIDLKKESDENWQWQRFSHRSKQRWIPQGDGTFELQLITTPTHALSVDNLPDVPGYATADIFTPHPAKPDLWRVVGRADDVLIHSSGEKTVPAPIEHVVMTSPLIQGAVMFGRQRDQAGILIEPSPGNEIDVSDDAEVSRFRNKIWPVIEEANRVAPAFSRIYKEMILITSRAKPLLRAAKGTIMRKATYKEYEKEIDQIYDNVESNAGSGSSAPPPSWEVSSVQEWIAAQVEDLCGNKMCPKDDIFEHGFDSLCATVLRLRTVGALRSNPQVHDAARLFTQNSVYNYPTIEQLTNFVVGLVRDPGQSDAAKTHETAMEEMIQKYSRDLEIPIQANETAPAERVVLLTGSTGNLGAQFLADLLANPTVHSVYTLNRPSSRTTMLERHRERFEDKALDVALLSSEKLVFLEGESSAPNLGLSDEAYNELRETITIVIHNAWRLDFNLSLSSFETHIRGTRNLIDLARSSRYVSSLRFLFTSSIGSTQGWDASTKGPYPEEVISDPQFAVGAGYGESKYVSERILAKSGLHASSFRIGQIAGGKPNGSWAMSDWLPLIIKSSVSLGKLPNAHGVISWAPMDAIAEAILDAAYAEEFAPIAINVVHPHPVSWTSIMEAIRSSLISAKKLDTEALPLVPCHQWLSALEDAAVNASAEKTANEIPAAKLLEFIRALAQADEKVAKIGSTSFEAVGLTPMTTTNIQRISARMRDLEPLGVRDVELWVKYWIQCGL